MTPPILQSYIGGRWVGREAAQALRSAVNGRPVASTHADKLDFAEAVPACPTCSSSISSSAPSG